MSDDECNEDDFAALDFARENLAFLCSCIPISDPEFVRQYVLRDAVNRSLKRIANVIEWEDPKKEDARQFQQYIACKHDWFDVKRLRGIKGAVRRAEKAKSDRERQWRNRPRYSYYQVCEDCGSRLVSERSDGGPHLACDNCESTRITTHSVKEKINGQS